MKNKAPDPAWQGKRFHLGTHRGGGRLGEEYLYWVKEDMKRRSLYPELRVKSVGMPG